VDVEGQAVVLVAAAGEGDPGAVRRPGRVDVVEAGGAAAEGAPGEGRAVGGDSEDAVAVARQEPVEGDPLAVGRPGGRGVAGRRVVGQVGGQAEAGLTM
jgi:hypothetical protein